MRADTATGEFLGSVERELRVGYESQIQFELNTDDYCFYGFEAVSQADKETSRSDCVEFTQVSKDDAKGIYKYNIKLLKESQDILIRPVCIERPRVVGIEPESLYVTYNQDSTIKFTFNKALKNESLANLIYYIFTDRDMNNKFEAPILSQDGKTLFIHPKAGEHIIEPDGTESVLNLKIDYDFTGVVDQDDLSFTSKGSHEYKISKSFTGEQIAKVFIPAKNSSGYFSSSGEKSCTVGYSLELQYTLTDDSYTFVDFEAVSNDGDNSVSRNSSVSFEDKYYNQEAGMFRAKLFVNELYDDILIRPVLKELPGVKEHTSTNGSETLSVDKPIKIVFNTEIDIQKVLNTISVICKTNDESLLETCFKEPVYDSLSHVLTLYPEPLLLKDYIDNLHAGTVDLQISLDKEIRNSTFTIRYKADVEKTAPSAADFIVSRNPITLENISGTNESYKLSLKAIDITADEIPPADIQKNRAGNGAVYIYGRYFDEESGVRDVVVSKRMLQDNGELSSAAETTFNSRSDSQIAQFTSDGQGNTSFVIKYNFANLGKAYVLDIVVRDNCDNRATAKTVSVFVPVYGEALGDNFYYLKNKPDYENVDLTIEQYSAELKNLKIYPDSFTVYSDVKFPANELNIYCEYKDKTGANKRQKFNLNEGENPYWNCPLNVDSLANLNIKITVYDGNNIYDQREFKFPARTAFNIDWIENRLHYSRPNYQIRILAEPEHTVFGVYASFSSDYPDGKVTGVEYPLEGYETLDLYTEYDWVLETYNQQGLYSDAVSFEDILEEYNINIPSVTIKSVDEDASSWRTNGGYFVYTITLADDTWEEGKYEQLFYDICYVGASVNDPQEIQKNEYTITVKIPLSELTEKWANIIITGKKGFKKSSAYKRVNSVDAVDYDVVPPNVYASHASYDYWTFNVNEYTGSGAKEADFTVGNKTYHVDENNRESDDRLTVKIPAKLIEELRTQNGSVEYTACDNAGNTVTGVLELNDGGQGDNFKLIKTRTTGVSVSFDRYTYDSYDTETKFYFYEFDDSDPEAEDDWKTEPSVSSTDEINYQYAGENDDIFRYQKYINGLPESKFLKVVGYNIIYFPAPQYVYLGEWGSGDYDLLMPNASSKKSVIICSDAPVYVHTLVTKCPYETCKDWDASTWEYYKDDIGKRIMNFTADKEVEGNLVTGDHNPKIYKIPEDIEKGSCYCVIAHFANGDVLMSEVMQK